MVPTKRTNSRCSVLITKPKIDVEKFIMLAVYTICFYLLCTLCVKVAVQIVRKGATTVIFGDLHWMYVAKSAKSNFLYICTHSVQLKNCISTFYVHDEVGVLLSFCRVIVCDIFHVLFLQSQYFRTAEPEASSQKWRNATQKVKLQIDDESENHSFSNSIYEDTFKK